MKCKCGHDLEQEHGFSKHTGDVICFTCECYFTIFSDLGRVWIKVNKGKVEDFEDVFTPEYWKKMKLSLFREKATKGS